MSFRPALLASIILILLGLIGIGAGTALFLRGSVAEGKLALSVNVHPTDETFPGVVESATRILKTLAERSTFDTFRTKVISGGFDVSPDAFQGSAVEHLWSRRVRVEQIDDTLVLRVRTHADTPQLALALARGVLHTLVLEAPTIVGNQLVHARIERMPVLLDLPHAVAWRTAALAGGSVTLFFGLCALLWTVLRRHLKGHRLLVQEVPSEMATPSSPAMAPERSSPEEARFWLQKFLEQHQAGRHTPPDRIVSWDDVPSPTRDSRWMKPPDALLL